MAGCTAQPTPTTNPTPEVAPTEQPTPEVVEAEPMDMTVASTLQANTETSLLKWDAKKVGGAHFGTVKLNTGSLDFNAENQLVGGTFVIDMTTITVDDMEPTNNMHGALLSHLQSDDFFSVETNPTSTLTITDVKLLTENSYEVTGDLTIKGITNPVTFVATVDESMTFTAPIVIDRTLWDIKFRSLKFFSDVVDVAIEDNIVYTVTINTVQ
jgi:polyisoprenoid-binding protein YceI